jgi:AhpD family alkylhydroperoxidase
LVRSSVDWIYSSLAAGEFYFGNNQPLPLKSKNDSITLGKKEQCISTFDHAKLMKKINDSLGPFRKSQADVIQGFVKRTQGDMAEGTISANYKELIALSIGISQHFSGCIAFHEKALIKLGATRSELEEMLAVCVCMGGGPSLMYAAEALAAWDSFSAQGSS